jgi:hypothetical protein
LGEGSEVRGIEGREIFIVGCRLPVVEAPPALKAVSFNPVSGIQLAKYLLLLPPAEIIIALIWASLHNRDAP